MSTPRDVFVELFEIRVRGALASTFNYSGEQPSDDHWQILRGEREVTLREIGEIGFLTDTQFDISITKFPTDEPTD